MAGALVYTNVEFSVVLVTPVFTGVESVTPARPESLMPAVGLGDAKVALGVASTPPAEAPINPELLTPAGKVF
jgi:hypothetical protein